MPNIQSINNGESGSLVRSKLNQVIALTNAGPFPYTGSATITGSLEVVGDVTIQGTASITVLHTTYESASVIYSSGSNVFGDALDDIQTLNGTVLVIGSQQITGSLGVSQGITGSLQGTASYSDNSTSASYSDNSTSASYALDSTNSSNASTASYVDILNQNIVVSGSLAIQDVASTFNIIGNGFGQTYLQSLNGALVLNPGYGGVNINGANPSLKVDGNITTDGYVASNAAGSYLTGSLLGTSSYALNSTSASYSDNATSASYAATASYAPLYLPLTGGTIAGNLTIIGTASFAYTTASIVQVGAATITLNTDNPAIRFGGITVIDSGSFGNSSTGSMLWDSQNNRWIYSNPSGSTYDSGMLISGPKNTSGIGNEQGVANNVLTKGQGGDHITSSQVTDDGTTVNIPGTLTVGTGITGSLFGTASYTVQAISSSYSNNSTSASYALTASYALNGGGTTVNTGSLVTTSSFNSYTGSTASRFAGTASYATTASYALNGGVTSIVAGTNITISSSTGSVTINSSGGGGASFPYTGSAVITGSLVVTGSTTSTGGFIKPGAGTQYLLADGSSTAGTGGAAFPYSGAAVISGSLSVSGILQVNNSNVVTSDVTSSMTVATASYVQQAQSSSYSSIASTLENISTLATTGSNTFVGDQVITGSLTVTNGIVGPLVGTSSYSTLSENSLLLSGTGSNSFINTGAVNSLQTITGSLVITQGLTVMGSASFTYVTSSQTTIANNTFTVSLSNPGVPTGGFIAADSGSGVSSSLLYNIVDEYWQLDKPLRVSEITGSLYGTASYTVQALTSSYSVNGVSSSYALTASYSNNSTSASYSNNSTSASYSNNSTSASYAATASYAANAGGGGLENMFMLMGC